MCLTHFHPNTRWVVRSIIIDRERRPKKFGQTISAFVTLTSLPFAQKLVCISIEYAIDHSLILGIMVLGVSLE